MKRIAVFASGSGSDFQSVIDANEREPFCEISLLVASKAGIGAVDRAVRACSDSSVRAQLIKNAMSSDFSFTASAYEYGRLYLDTL